MSYKNQRRRLAHIYLDFEGFNPLRVERPSRQPEIGQFDVPYAINKEVLL